MLRDVLNWLCVKQETVKIDVYPTTSLCSLASLPDELYNFVLTRIFVHSAPSDHLSLLLVSKKWNAIGRRVPLSLRPNKFLPLALRHGFPKIGALDLSAACEVLDERLPCLVVLENLVSLKLKRCREITDEGLTHLHQLTRLKDLNLGRCSLIKDAGFVLLCQNLLYLRRLNIKHCYGLTSNALVALSSLSSLEVFNCSGCQGLRYEVLAMIGQVSTLRVLKINQCSAVVSPGIDPLLKLCALDSLQLKMEDVNRPSSDVLLQNFEQSFRRLRRLDVSLEYSVSSVGFHALASMHRLEVLCLEGEGLIDKGILLTVAQLPCLTKFQLLDDSDGCASVTPLSTLKRLRSLTIKRKELSEGLAGSQLNGQSELTQLTELVLRSDASLIGSSIETLTELQRLFLHNCPHLKSENMTCFAKLRCLRVLNFRICVHLDDEFIISLQGLPQLEQLYISACHDFTGRYFGALSPLTELSIIVLQFSRGINDFAIKQLTGIISLRRLELVMCPRVTEDGLRVLLNADLINLEYLNISGCQAPRLTTQTFQSRLPKFKKLITGSVNLSMLK